MAVRLVSALLAVGALAVGVAATRPDRPKPRDNELEIAINWVGGQPIRSWTLRCPAGGTLPNPDRACAQLEALGPRAFTEKDTSAGCPGNLGGDLFGAVRGRWRGRRIEIGYGLERECAVNYRNRYSFLFPLPW